jgi:hypothetical protein
MQEDMVPVKEPRATFQRFDGITVGQAWVSCIVHEKEDRDREIRVVLKAVALDRGTVKAGVITVKSALVVIWLMAEVWPLGKTFYEPLCQGLGEQ